MYHMLRIFSRCTEHGSSVGVKRGNQRLSLASTELFV